MSEIFCESTKVYFENFNRLSDNNFDLKLFKIKLSSYNHLITEFTKHLCESEKQRAQNYHFKKDSNRFIICRALLKFILARQTSEDISNICIKIDDNKKPYITSSHSLFFNVSHAENYAIIALSNIQVGIDLEYKNKKFDFTEILPFTFSDLEIKTISKSTDKTAMFYNFWTRKEAIVKATGQGISDHLSQIPVINGRHFIDAHILNDINNLQVLSFNLDEDYIAAVALKDINLKFNKILIYDLPDNIADLKSFSNYRNPD